MMKIVSRGNVELSRGLSIQILGPVLGNEHAENKKQIVTIKKIVFVRFIRLLPRIFIYPEHALVVG
jgi:hypothetical protein